MSKYTKIRSNHFEYGRPVESAPNPTFFLKGYDNDAKVDVKRKVATSRKELPATKKSLRKELVLGTKKSQPEKKQLREIPADPEHYPLSSFSSSCAPFCSTFADVSPLSSEIGNIDSDISETRESKIAEEPLSISTTPLYEPKIIISNLSSSNERQHQVISCPRLSLKYIEKYPKIVKLYNGYPAAAAFDFIINHFKPKHGKSSILKGIKWKKQKDISLANASHFFTKSQNKRNN